MNIIFVIVSMAGGGAERVISILANQFVKQSIGVTIIMTAGDEMPVSYQLDERIKLISAGGTSGGSLSKRFKRVAKMRRIFKKQKDAIIISFGPGTSFFAVTSALFLPNRIIISERNDPAVCPYPRLRNLIYQRAKYLVFQTDAALKCFPRSIRKKGFVIGNPLDDKLLPIRNENENGRKFEIVAVGRLEPQKNYALLLEAFALFIRKNHVDITEQYTLAIYGNGSLDNELKNQAKILGIEKKIIFAGFHFDVMEKIKNSAMYILSSDYEGIPNSLLEAMAIGLPVISTDCPIGGSKALIQDGENGILVPVGDIEALANAIFTLVRNPDSAKAMGEKASKARDLYSVDVIAGQWLDVVKKTSK
ncbi:MAG: glycosyltransferase [Lachnospiraceae bacterium]|nr:glycosyltransferase [Lachnospiraceae bacterium]